MGSSRACAKPAASPHRREMGTGKLDPPTLGGKLMVWSPQEEKALAALCILCIHLFWQVFTPHGSLMAAPLLGFGFTGGNAGRASSRVTLMAATQR